MKMLHGEKPIWSRPAPGNTARGSSRPARKTTPVRIHGNVLNSNGDGAGTLITNLPADGVVEVACMIDANGINPTRYGALPPQMAALCDWNMRMYDLGRDRRASSAAKKPPSTPCCSTRSDRRRVQPRARSRTMTLELFDAEAEFLPGYK